MGDPRVAPAQSLKWRWFLPITIIPDQKARALQISPVTPNGGRPMKIAITTWGNRVSPVFDSAQTLLIAEVADGSVKEIIYEKFNPENPLDLTTMLHRLKISILICGAISTRPANAIVENKIRLISFVSGNAMDILNTFARRNTIDPSFMMPGCSLAYSRR